MNKHLRLIYIVAFPALVFTLWQPTWAILDPTYWQWLLDENRGQHFVGAHLFRLDDWRWPLGQTQLALYPHGFNMVYTDSTPIMAVLVKLLSPILPSHVQYTGFWYLFVCYANFIAFLAILRHFDMDEVTQLLVASLLIFYPPFFGIYHIPPLTSFFLFLFPLALFFDKDPDSKRKYFAFWVILACLINIYFVPMVFLLALLRPFFRNNQWNQAGAREAGFNALACIIPAIVVMAIFGAFGGYENAYPRFYSSGMQILAMFDPHPWDFKLLHNYFLSSSRFFATDVSWRGSGGYQYWGLGWIAIIIGSLFVGKPYFTRQRRIILWGIAIFLTLIAVSPRVYVFNFFVFQYEIGILKYLFNFLPGHSRFFWLVSMIIMLMALLRLYNHLDRKKFPLVIMAALVLQVADVRIFTHLDGDRAIDSTPLTSLLKQLPEPPPFIAVSGDLRRKANYHIAIRAADAGIPVNNMYLARQRKVKGEILPISKRSPIAFRYTIDAKKNPYRLPHLGEVLKEGAWAITPKENCFDLLSRDRAAVAVDFYEWRDFCFLTPAGAIPSSLQSSFDLVRKDPSRQPSINTIFEDCDEDCTLILLACANIHLNIHAFPQLLQKMKQLGGHIIERDPIGYYAIIENGQLVRESVDTSYNFKNYEALVENNDKWVHLSIYQRPRYYHAQGHDIMFDETVRCSVFLNGYKYHFYEGLHFISLRSGTIDKNYVLRSYE